MFPGFLLVISPFQYIVSLDWFRDIEKASFEICKDKKKSCALAQRFQAKLSGAKTDTIILSRAAVGSNTHIFSRIPGESGGIKSMLLCIMAPLQKYFD